MESVIRSKGAARVKLLLVARAAIGPMKLVPAMSWTSSSMIMLMSNALGRPYMACILMIRTTVWIENVKVFRLAVPRKSGTDHLCQHAPESPNMGTG